MYAVTNFKISNLICEGEKSFVVQRLKEKFKFEQ